MLVIVKNTPVELPDLEAEILLHRGIAHLPEVADLPMPMRFASSGIQTHHSSPPATVRKPRKPSQGSSKKVTK